MFDQREKIALFIDGANLYATSKTLGFDIDYKRMLVHFEGLGYLLPTWDDGTAQNGWGCLIDGGRLEEREGLNLYLVSSFFFFF